MATPTVYVLCDQNCKFESMTKEQILTAITQAVNEGTISDIDTGFVQTIKTINGTALRFFVGTKYEYDALAEEDKQNLFAIITNDTTKEGIERAIEELQTEFVELKNGLNSGNVVVANANKAKLDYNGNNIANTYLKKADRARLINYYVDGIVTESTDIYIGTRERIHENVCAICINTTQGTQEAKRQYIGVRSGIVYTNNGYDCIDFIINGGGFYYASQSSEQAPSVDHGIGFVKLKRKVGDENLYLEVIWSSGIAHEYGVVANANAYVTNGIIGDALVSVSVLYE